MDFKAIGNKKAMWTEKCVHNKIKLCLKISPVINFQKVTHFKFYNPPAPPHLEKNDQIENVSFCCNKNIAENYILENLKWVMLDSKQKIVNGDHISNYKRISARYCKEDEIRSDMHKQLTLIK